MADKSEVYAIESPISEKNEEDVITLSEYHPNADKDQLAQALDHAVHLLEAYEFGAYEVHVAMRTLRAIEEIESMQPSRKVQWKMVAAELKSADRYAARPEGRRLHKPCPGPSPQCTHDFGRQDVTSYESGDVSKTRFKIQDFL